MQSRFESESASSTAQQPRSMPPSSVSTGPLPSNASGASERRPEPSNNGSNRDPWATSNLYSGSEAPSSRQSTPALDNPPNGAPSARTTGANKQQHNQNPPARPNRVRTVLEDAAIQEKHTRNYFFRRPRPLQFEHEGHLLEVGDSNKIDLEHPEKTYEEMQLEKSRSEDSQQQPNTIHKQRDRMDLFIDLIWVGIISNISENFFNRAFSEHVSPKLALGEFVLLFIPSWRLWYLLQRFLNIFYLDDFPQRVLILWILILGLVWGNNAPYFFVFDQPDPKVWLIGAYLVGVVSLLLAELAYSIWIAQLRWPVFLACIIAIPSVALWVASCVVTPGELTLDIVSAAMVYDALQVILLGNPIMNRVLGNQKLRVAADAHHFIHRFENFFIIALGEGIFLIIRGSPTGNGLTQNLARAVQALLIYYFLNWLYFNGDMSRRFVHPWSRRFWISTLWKLLHVPLYAALVLLSSGVLYLVSYEGPETTTAVGIERLARRVEAGEHAPIQDHKTMKIASVTVCVSVAVSLACMTIMGLLVRPLDQPGVMRANSRYIRLLPRVLGVIALSSFWVADFYNPNDVLGIVLLIVFVITMTEFILGQSPKMGLFEPRNTEDDERS